MNALEQAAAGAEEADHGQAMDRMYRLQRHVYDATRKYYLLGRDQLVADLRVPPGGQVLEMGCGTGRNLLKVAQRYPDARVYGIDISSEMLKSALQSLARSADRGRIAVACADATDFNPAKAFGVGQFERVFFSYTLSMIPDWQAALEQAFGMLSPDGELHIVDFGQSEGLPRAFRAGLFAWLRHFDVTPRSNLLPACRSLAMARGATVSFSAQYRGYCWRLRAKKAVD